MQRPASCVTSEDQITRGLYAKAIQVRPCVLEKGTKFKDWLPLINCPGAGVQISSWKAPCKRSPLEPQAVTAAVSRDPSRPGVSLARKVCAPPRGYLGATELRVVSVARLDLELVEYTIPIVIPAAIDPVGAGLAESIARPGGDVTGFALLTPEISSKRRGCLRRPCLRCAGSRCCGTRATLRSRGSVSW